MAHRNNFDRSCFIVDQIQDTIVADPDTIAIVAMQFLDAVWTRVILQFKEFTHDSLVNIFGKLIEFPFRSATKDNCVGHDALFGFAGGQVFAQWSARFGTTLLDCGNVEQVFMELPILQQPFDHRFALSLFQTAESGVHSVCCLSNHVGHM